jgi:hypothetical protein
METISKFALLGSVVAAILAGLAGDLWEALAWACSGGGWAVAYFTERDRRAVILDAARMQESLANQ